MNTTNKKSFNFTKLHKFLHPLSGTKRKSSTKFDKCFLKKFFPEVNIHVKIHFIVFQYKRFTFSYSTHKQIIVCCETALPYKTVLKSMPDLQNKKPFELVFQSTVTVMKELSTWHIKINKNLTFSSVILRFFKFKNRRWKKMKNV